MRDPEKTNWMDLAEKMIVPLVIFVGGIAYTIHKDHLDEQRQKTEKAEANQRQQLDRDSGYIKLLASSNDQEKDLGLRIISVLQSEGKFSPDLIPIVKAMSAGRPSDPVTQAAARIVSKVPENQQSQDAPAAGQNAPIDVYVQIWQEAQRPRALEVQRMLREKGFATPAIQLVPHATFHTYVRFFATDRSAKANEIRDALTTLGFKPQVQSFVDDQQLKSEALEVWFGADEPATSAHETN